MYYIYILRCKDNSLYTGIAANLKKRMTEHFLKTEKCAKYTRSKGALSLEACWQSETRSEASKLEYAIKKCTKKEKERMVQEPETLSLLMACPKAYHALDKTELARLQAEILGEDY